MTKYELFEKWLTETDNLAVNTVYGTIILKKDGKFIINRRETIERESPLLVHEFYADENVFIIYNRPVTTSEQTEYNNNGQVTGRTFHHSGIITAAMDWQGIGLQLQDEEMQPVFTDHTKKLIRATEIVDEKGRVVDLKDNKRWKA